MPEMTQEALLPFLGKTVTAKIRYYSYHGHLQTEVGLIRRADNKPDGMIGIGFRGDFAVPHKIEGLNCPYCKCRVEETPLKHYVNGIVPVMLNEGCEFCQPLPLTVRAAYDSDETEWGPTIEEARALEVCG